jgi:hypothetical protein
MKSLSDNAIRKFVFGICTFVFSAGACLCYLSPAQAWAWSLAMVMLPFAWIVLHLVKGHGARDILSPLANRKQMRAMALAGTLLAVSLVTALLSRMGWSAGHAPELSERSWGIVMGAIVVVFGNAIPKEAGFARRLTIERTCGWALVLGGMGFAASWIFVPLAYANEIAMLVLMSALLYAMVRIAWYCVGRRSPPSSG